MSNSDATSNRRLSGRIPLSPLRPASPVIPGTTTGAPSVPRPRRVSEATLSALSPRSQEASLPPVTAEPRKRTRAQNLLRQHYGMTVGPPSPLPGKPNDPMNLDSTAFDTKSYYDQLITTSNLLTLLRRENELMQEMRELDSERQSLVYNHHHELIAASDTIAAMKARAESLDGDLDSLKAAFSEISRLGAEVSIDQQPSSSSPRKE